MNPQQGVRKYRGKIVCDPPKQLSYTGPPQTREQDLELTESQLHAMWSQLRGLPICMEHDGVPIGKVAEPYWDEKGNACIEFELFDDNTLASLPRRALEEGLITELSLAHNRDTLEPVEVSIVLDGARSGTKIDPVIRASRYLQNSSMIRASSHQTVVRSELITMSTEPSSQSQSLPPSSSPLPPPLPQPTVMASSSAPPPTSSPPPPPPPPGMEPTSSSSTPSLSNVLETVTSTNHTLSKDTRKELSELFKELLAQNTDLAEKNKQLEQRMNSIEHGSQQQFSQQSNLLYTLLKRNVAMDDDTDRKVQQELTMSQIPPNGAVMASLARVNQDRERQLADEIKELRTLVATRQTANAMRTVASADPYLASTVMSSPVVANHPPQPQPSRVAYNPSYMFASPLQQPPPPQVMQQAPQPMMVEQQPPVQVIQASSSSSSSAFSMGDHKKQYTISPQVIAELDPTLRPFFEVRAPPSNMVYASRDKQDAMYESRAFSCVNGQPRPYIHPALKKALEEARAMYGTSLQIPKEVHQRVVRPNRSFFT